uniref:Lipoprotein n=1 Tax=Coralloluteibacterium stylophorae TaxID=1776034 RepID=A0A8J7VVS0_9GAMM
MRRFLALSKAFLISALLLSGCVSSRGDLLSQVSDRGANSTSVASFMGIAILTTASVIPGELPFDEVADEVDNCRLNETSIEIYSPHPVDGSSLLCEQLLSAVTWVRQLAGATGRTGRFRVTLVPAGRSFVTSRSSISIGGSMDVSFAFPWSSEDSRASTANVISKMAHETVHVAAGVLGKPAALQRDEVLAYELGACAQLKFLGVLQERDLPRGSLPSFQNLPKEAIASSRHGLDAASAVRKYMVDGQVSKKSANGINLISACEEKARSAFSSPGL